MQLNNVLILNATYTENETSYFVFLSPRYINHIFQYILVQHKSIVICYVPRYKRITVTVEIIVHCNEKR